VTQETWAARTTRRVIDEVKRQRDLKGWSAHQLSEECKKLGFNISRNTISDLENHRRANFGIPELLVLARALGISPLLLLFRVGVEAEAEVLPGEFRAPFRAAEWFAGLGPYPEPGDGSVVTIPEVYDPAEAGPLALYRYADRLYELERREAHRAAMMAASAEGRPGYMAAADAHQRQADSARAQREAQAAEAVEAARAKDEKFVPPPAEMSLRPPGDDLIV
jgi:transcriptional regulator with XRE-family HTH domain